MSHATKRSDERSLLVIIVDVSPTPWGERDLKRSANDKARLAAGKRSVGPATLEDTLGAIRVFGGAFSSLERDCVLIVIAVAANECAVVYPRKNELHRFFHDTGSNMDIRLLHEGLVLGVAELVTRAAAKADKSANDVSSQKNVDSSAAMAAALSLGLCCINRFLVASSGGVSALTSDSSALWKRQEDDGVVSLMSSGTTKRSRTGLQAWSPRVLLIQASEDRSQDYNAFMNCAFAATKHNIILDGCFIPSGISTGSKSSPFLEQVCDRTGGVFLAPSGAAQVGGALSEVLLSVFLPPRSARPQLNLPAINKVDFRARCFETGESVDMAHVCNQCLSIFKTRPKDFCPTCGAEIKGTGDSKRRKET